MEKCNSKRYSKIWLTSTFSVSLEVRVNESLFTTNAIYRDGTQMSVSDNQKKLDYNTN